MENAAIVGLGVVGMATAKALSIKKYFDLEKKDGDFELIDIPTVAEQRYVFICLPTPVDQAGRYKVDHIIDIVEAIADHGKQNVFIIRSTVYPGFAKYLAGKIGHNGVVSNPEFLTEKTWEKDAINPDIIVIGSDRPNYLKDVVGIYKARYKGVDIVQTDSVTAELIKLAINGFYTTKVVYANQLYDFAGKVGANYTQIKEAMYKRQWIGKNHLDVFHQGGRGAGGKCLPKDMEALQSYSQAPLFGYVSGLNKSYLMSSDKK